MTSKTETPDSRLDALKSGVALLLVAGAIGGFYYFGQYSTLLRVIGLLVVIGLALAVFLQTSQGRSAREFIHEARVEIRKVVWPTRKETVQTTSIVIAMVAAVAVFLWLLDMLLAWGMRTVIGHGV